MLIIAAIAGLLGFGLGLRLGLFGLFAATAVVAVVSAAAGAFLIEASFLPVVGSLAAGATAFQLAAFAVMVLRPVFLSRSQAPAAVAAEAGDRRGSRVATR